MPTIFTHAVVGAAAGVGGRLKNLPRRFWFLTILLPILPDADVIMFRLGIPYGHWLGHRGLFHSIPFALVLALVVVILFFRKEQIFSGRWLALVGYFFLLTASHGILDAMTDGGGGVALFSPFDNTRHFLPWRPIPVSPIGLRMFFSEWGARVLFYEVAYIWLPLGVVLAIRKLRWGRLWG